MLHQPCPQLPMGCWGWKHHAVTALPALTFYLSPWLLAPREPSQLGTLPLPKDVSKAQPNTAEKGKQKSLRPPTWILPPASGAWKDREPPLPPPFAVSYLLPHRLWIFPSKQSSFALGMVSLNLHPCHHAAAHVVLSRRVSTPQLF